MGYRYQPPEAGERAPDGEPAGRATAGGKASPAADPPHRENYLNQADHSETAEA